VVVGWKSLFLVLCIHHDHEATWARCGLQPTISVGRTSKRYMKWWDGNLDSVGDGCRQVATTDRCTVFLRKRDNLAPFAKWCIVHGGIEPPFDENVAFHLSWIRSSH